MHLLLHEGPTLINLSMTDILRPSAAAAGVIHLQIMAKINTRTLIYQTKVHQKSGRRLIPTQSAAFISLDTSVGYNQISSLSSSKYIAVSDNIHY